LHNLFNPPGTRTATARTYLGVGAQGYSARRSQKPENCAVEPKDEIMEG